MTKSERTDDIPEGEDTIYHRYAKYRLAGWVLPMLKAGVAVDSVLFESLAWALDLPPLQRKIYGPIFASGVPGAGRASGSAMKEDPEELAGRRDRCRQEIIRTAEKLAAGMPESPWSTSRRRFGRMFGLKDDELDVCEMTFIIRSFPQVRTCLEDYFRIMDMASAAMLAKMLGTSKERVLYIRRSLESLGLVKGSGPFVFMGNVEKLWRNPICESPAAYLPVPGGDILPLGEFAVPESGLGIARELLTQRSGSPVHILVYGGTGTGKTSFVRSLAEECRIPVYPVTFQDDGNPEEWRRAVEAGFSAAAVEEGSMVLIEDADRMLSSEGTSSSSFLKSLLERKDTRAVWTTTHPEAFEDSLKRRFGFSLPLNDPEEWRRVEMWQGELRRQGLGSMYERSGLLRLVRRCSAPVAVFTTCLREAKAIAYKESDIPSVLEGLLEAHGVLIRNGERRARPVGEDVFTPQGVNVEGAIEDFLGRCARLGRKLDEARGRGVIPARCATMLFYGPPGTGKTALARHIAEMTGKPVVERRASDILDRYVGVTEKSIAAAFEDAERTGAVLLIDEADSFLMNRSDARHSWEATMVNEFLTRLESCRTFCVCTTNRKDMLDPASLRRFTFKLEFGYAGPEQALALYRILLAPWATEELTLEQQQRLKGMERLTPGAFGNVRTQIWLEEEGSLPVDSLLDLLEKECGHS